MDWQCLSLSPRMDSMEYCYLFGGYSGTDFLVKALGLEQPRASRGVVRCGVSFDASSEQSSKVIQNKKTGGCIEERRLHQ